MFELRRGPGLARVMFQCKVIGLLKTESQVGCLGVSWGYLGVSWGYLGVSWNYLVITLCVLRIAQGYLNGSYLGLLGVT